MNQQGAVVLYWLLVTLVCGDVRSKPSEMPTTRTTDIWGTTPLTTAADVSERCSPRQLCGAKQCCKKHKKWETYGVCLNNDWDTSWCAQKDFCNVDEDCSGPDQKCAVYSGVFPGRWARCITPIPTEPTVRMFTSGNELANTTDDTLVAYQGDYADVWCHTKDYKYVPLRSRIYHNGDLVHVGTYAHHPYVIERLSAADSGPYTCMQVNTETGVESDVSAQFRLIVKETPDKPTGITVTSTEVLAGGTTSLTCHHDNLGFSWSYRFEWEKDGEALDESGYDGRIAILTVESFASSDAGDYTCAVVYHHLRWGQKEDVPPPIFSPHSEPITLTLLPRNSNESSSAD